MPTLKLYHAPNTRSVRIVWLLEELGLPYTLERYKLGDPAMRTAEYRAVHPLGRVPVLEDGDVRLYESGAIVQYLLARYGEGRLAPAMDSPQFAPYLQWLHYAEGMLMPPVNTIVVETVLLPEEKRNAENVERAKRLLQRMLGVVEQALGDDEHLAGAFSAADIMTGHACWVAARLVGDISDKPRLQAYIERVTARPAFQRATEA